DCGVLVLLSPIKGVIRENRFCGIRPFLLVDDDDRRSLHQFTFQESAAGKHPTAMLLNDVHSDAARVWIGWNQDYIPIDSANALRSSASAIEAAAVVPPRQNGSRLHVFLDRNFVVSDRQF